MKSAGAPAIFRSERGRRKLTQGKRRGIGISNYVEVCAIGPSAIAGGSGADYGLWESATVRFLPVAKLEVVTGSHSQGQGHEPLLRQVASSVLVSLEDISVCTAILDALLWVWGPMAQDLSVGGSAVVLAAKNWSRRGE